MVAIESTSATATKRYATMRQNLRLGRRRLQEPLTANCSSAVSSPETQELAPGRSCLALRPDCVVFQTKRERIAVATTIHCDHLIQARTDGEADLGASLDKSKEVYDFLRPRNLVIRAKGK